MKSNLSNQLKTNHWARAVVNIERSKIPTKKASVSKGFLNNNGSEFPYVTEHVSFFSQILDSGNSETPYRGVIDPLASTFSKDSSATLLSIYHSNIKSAILSRS